MDIIITPSQLAGNIRSIPSKSQAQRALICAALSDRPMEVILPEVSKDVEAVISCLRAMGCKIREGKGSRWRVEPLSKKKGGKGHQGPVHLNCKESGAALRFLLPVAGAIFPKVMVEGEGALPRRPIMPLLQAMEKRGSKFSSISLPITMEGQLKGGRFDLPGDVSSQFVTGLLLAAPLLKEDSEIVLSTLLESENYIDLTIDVMERFGVAVYENENGYQVCGRQEYRSPKDFRIEGDWSTAAYWLTARAMGQEVKPEGLSGKSVQGDRQIRSLLRLFTGERAAREESPENVAGAGDEANTGRVEDRVIDGTHIPDLIPPLAVIASVTRGVTRIENAGRLRLKESDRLRNLAEGLAALGADIVEEEDALVITGKDKLQGGEVSGYNDHRMIMAFTIASLACEGPVTILGAEAVKKSYPRFFKDFRRLGGQWTEVGKAENEGGDGNGARDRIRTQADHEEEAVSEAEAAHREKDLVEEAVSEEAVSEAEADHQAEVTAGVQTDADNEPSETPAGEQANPDDEPEAYADEDEIQTELDDSL